MNAGPVVRVAVDLGDYRPRVDPEDHAWQPLTYTIHAHHAATLTEDAVRVVERNLERITLVLTNAHPDAYEEVPARTELELPVSVKGLEALIDILAAARDYLAQEDTR